jgi:ribosome recycling factor
MPESDVVLEEARQAMQKSVDGLHRELGRIRTGRANPALLDGVMVDYYGTPTPLKALATLHAPEARLLTLSAFDPSTLPAIEKAILKADLGLKPVNDGKLLRVPIPELTEERRKEFVKLTRKHCEDHKLGVRHARRDALALLKELEDSGDVDADEARRLQKKIQDLTDQFVKSIDQEANRKEEEILRI